jgi:hypothetical protein
MKLRIIALVLGVVSLADMATRTAIGRNGPFSDSCGAARSQKNFALKQAHWREVTLGTGL